MPNPLQQSLSVASGLSPQPAASKPASSLSVGNIAAAMRPTATQSATQQQPEIADEFGHDVAFNLAFIGSGQGGARIASSFHSLGYRRVCLFNTAENDFEGLSSDIQRHVLNLGGAAKDAKFAETALIGQTEAVRDLLQRAWGNNADYGLICVGLGGGTGSGTSHKMVEIAREFMASKGKPPRVGVIASIPSPSEGQQVCRNALVALQRLIKMKVSPLILIDNAKINTIYKPGMRRLYPTANSTVSGLFHLFNQLAAVHSDLITFDRSELAQLLDNGIVVMGAATLTNVTTPADVSEGIRNQLSQNVLADVDLQTGSKGACLFVVSEELLDTLDLSFFEAGFTQMNRTLKGGEGGSNVVHRGIYSNSDPSMQVYAMISDLSPPMETLVRLSNVAKMGDMKTSGGLAEFLSL